MIIIKRHDIDGTPFETLKVGTVFLWDDAAHLKICTIFDHQGNVKNNAIRLGDGFPKLFKDTEIVYPRPHAHLIVN